MPSAPSSASPTAIAIAATRTVATARVALSSQVAVAPPKQLLLLKPLQSEDAPAPPLRPAKQFQKSRIDGLLQIQEARSSLEAGSLEIS